LGVLLIILLTALAAASTSDRAASPHARSSASWSGAFDSGTFAGWDDVIRAAPNRLSVVRSPMRQGGYAAKFSVADSDVAPATPTDDPRAQLNSPFLSRAGDDQYFGWSTLFPANFPDVPRSGFFVFFQWHGPPWHGSPRLGFNVAGGRIFFGRDRQYGYDKPWSTRLVRGRWHDFVLHVKWSKDPRVGFVELWFHGHRQRFRNGAARLYMATLKDDQRAVETIATNYRERGMVRGTVTIYQDAVRAGRSFSEVSP
jgi:hypothetical protein